MEGNRSRKPGQVKHPEGSIPSPAARRLIWDWLPAPVANRSAPERVGFETSGRRQPPTAGADDGLQIRWTGFDPPRRFLIAAIAQLAEQRSRKP